MIFELKKDAYEKVREIFKPLEFNLITRAVIEGTSPGRIYVDDVTDPRTAFMCTVEGYYLAGNEHSSTFNMALGRLIRERIFTGDTVREDERSISLCVYPSSWESKLDVIFMDRTPIEVIRRHYIYAKKKSSWEKRVSGDFSVQRIDEGFLKRKDLEIPDHIVSWIKTNWDTIEDFLQKGFGFCTLHDKEVVSWCIADCVSGNACEVGIRTIPDYRRQGLATLTVSATVRYCLSHGFTAIGWHCDEDNLGSIGVAEKVGFERERDYIFYTYMFDEAEHIAEVGYVYCRGKQYQEAAKCYEKAFTMREDLPHYYYHDAARVWAALGNKNKAFRNLNMAIDKGWTSLEFTENCEEFKSFHGTKSWKEIIRRHRS
ncbi:MAG: GNAT family N-acetyltransferase [Candidatus Hodarchaeota archaeon]